jgi:hypothetical protein
MRCSQEGRTRNGGDCTLHREKGQKRRLDAMGDSQIEPASFWVRAAGVGFAVAACWRLAADCGGAQLAVMLLETHLPLLGSPQQITLAELATIHWGSHTPVANHGCPDWRQS